jgi:outer membrane protein
MTEAIEVHRQSLETSKKNEERGRQMVDVGKMSKADLAQLTAQRSTDEYNIVEAESNLADSKLQLKQLLEITSTEAFEIAVPNTTDEQALAEIPSLAEVYETALGLRPEIRNSKLGIESSGLQLKIARAGWLPTVSMTGGLGTSTNSMSQNTWGSQMKTNFDASAGVSVSIPIVDGRKAKTAVNNARIALEQAQLELQDKEKQLYSTLEGFWLDAQNNQQKFRTSLTTVESEQASYNLLSEQFQLGLKNIVELMTGKDKLLQAQHNKLQSKYTTILAMQLLKFYQGYEMKT